MQALEADGDRLLLVADVDAQATQRLASAFGAQPATHWQQVVNDPNIEAVVVCTPPDLHAPVLAAALSAGKHVLCEKPLARSVAEAHGALQGPTKGSPKLKCGFNHRHFPGIVQAKQWCDEGLIGPLLYMRCRHGIGGRQDYQRDWRAQPDVSGGGELMDQGSHALDLFRWFMGEFHEVYATLITSYWEIAPVEDNAFGLLHQESGRVASLHASWTQWKNLFSLEIFGTEGHIQVEGLGGSYGTHEVLLSQRDFSKPFSHRRIEYRGPDISWSQEWREFKAAIQEDREPLGNGQDGLETLRLIEALYRSARQNRPVPVTGAA